MLAKPEVILEAVTPDPELVIERACRTCYLSWDRLNPPSSTSELIQKVIKKGHLSVLEHASATFRIKGGSRVFTHELVRHRLMSPSQESQRYVSYADRPDKPKTRDCEYVLPESVKLAVKAGSYVTFMDRCHIFYEELLDAGVPPEDARYVLPNATTSEIVITANMREYRHIFEVRGNPRAHWEIRNIAVLMFNILQPLAPNVFYDFRVDGDRIIKGGLDGDKESAS